MGLLFVLIFWGAVYCFVSLPILFIVSLTGEKGTRILRFKRTIFGMVLFPIIAFTLGIASSSILGTDLGIGDDFHVRIKNGYSLYCTDVPANGYICKDHNSVISGIDSISVHKNTSYLYVNEEYLFLNTETGEVVHNIAKPEAEMKDITSYYYMRFWTTGAIGLILSVLIAIGLSVFVSRKLIRPRHVKR